MFVSVPCKVREYFECYVMFFMLSVHVQEFPLSRVWVFRSSKESRTDLKSV